MKNILNYNFQEAKLYFLKEESYFNFDLPSYYVFQNLINKVSKIIDGKELKTFYTSALNPKRKKNYADSPRNYEDVNYKFLNNKDGKFA